LPRRRRSVARAINVKVRAANRSNAPAKVAIFQVSESEQPFMHVTH
jgi:hypothetical protein